MTAHATFTAGPEVGASAPFQSEDRGLDGQGLAEVEKWPSQDSPPIYLVLHPWFPHSTPSVTHTPNRYFLSASALLKTLQGPGHRHFLPLKLTLQCGQTGHTAPRKAGARWRGREVGSRGRGSRASKISGVKLGSEDVIWARSVPDRRPGGPGFCGHADCPLRAAGIRAGWGRGPGTAVTGLGPPIRPFIGAYSWAVGLPKGSHSEAGPGTAGGRRGWVRGLPAQRMVPAASACERQAAGHLLRPVKHICWALLGSAGPGLFGAGRERAQPQPRAAS